MNTQETLKLIGEKIRRYRLNRNMSRKEVAKICGVSLMSVVRLEEGSGTTLSNFIRILSAINALDSFEAFLPMPAISPLQLAKLEGKVRQRASKKI